MTRLAASSLVRSDLGLLEQNIRNARTAHAERLSAIGNLRDAAVLRLQALKDELAPLLAGSPQARRAIDLVLVPGDPPRLWIDMTAYVVMAPNPSTYRLQRDSFCRQELLLETGEREEIVAGVLRHVASHLVEREKQMQLMASGEAGASMPDASNQPLLLAWLSGLTIGIAAMGALLGWALH